jgi:uncharacterized protein
MHERVVLDTNVLISSLFWEKGKSHAIVERAIRRDILNFISQPLLIELSEKLRGKFEQPKVMVDRHIALVAAFSQIVTPTVSLDAVKDDPKDNMVVECAATARAQFIVTGDNHLLKLRSYQGIHILNPKEFLDMVQ